MKTLICLITTLVLISFACQSSKKSSRKQAVIPKTEMVNEHFPNVTVEDEKLWMENLVNVREINHDIFVDLKYATNDNFMKMKLYQKIKHAYLQEDVANRLAKCQQYLSAIHPNYHLLIYDAARPVSVQQKMWDALDTIPIERRIKFVSNPKNHSIHNYGAAVDLTICNEKKIPLDMGANYDDIRTIAYPRLEQVYLDSGLLTQEQINNRILLRKVMQKEGFINIPTEWWHFNACPRNQAKLLYKPILSE